MTQEEREDIIEEYGYQQKRYSHYLERLYKLEEQGKDTTAFEKTLEQICGRMRGIETVVNVLGYTIKENENGKFFIEEF